LYGWEPSGGERHKANLAFGGGAWAPAGMYYAFNMSALHEMMGAVETCPVVAPGDGMQGALFACAGRQFGTPEGDYAPPGEFDNYACINLTPAELAQTPLHELQGEGAGGQPLPGNMRTTVFHDCKDVANHASVWDAYYSRFFNQTAYGKLPEDDLHEGGPSTCTYARPGDHGYAW
jgi:hypothetical protein